jgi:multicomponent K+:H+ antiporter subunit A
MMLYETPHVALFGLPWLVPVLATIGATFSVGYSLRLAAHLFFGQPRDPQSFARAHDPAAGMWAPSALLTVLAVVLGLAPMALAATMGRAATGRALTAATADAMAVSVEQERDFGVD